MNAFAPEAEPPEPFDSPEIQKLFKRLYLWIGTCRHGGYSLIKHDRNASRLCGSTRKAKKCCLNRVGHVLEKAVEIIYAASKETT